MSVSSEYNPFSIALPAPKQLTVLLIERMFPSLSFVKNAQIFHFFSNDNTVNIQSLGSNCVNKFCKHNIPP